MKLIIAGGRDFNDWDLFQKGVLKFLMVHGWKYGLEIVSGGATGADKFGEKFAKDFNWFPVKNG